MGCYCYYTQYHLMKTLLSHVQYIPWHKCIKIDSTTPHKNGHFVSTTLSLLTVFKKISLAINLHVLVFLFFIE